MKLGVALCAISVTALLLLSSAPSGMLTFPVGTDQDSTAPQKATGIPSGRSLSDELPGLVEPCEPIPEVPAGDPPPEEGELRSLAELEGTYFFKNVRPRYYSYNCYYECICYCGDAEAVRTTDLDGLSIKAGSQPARTVEEADVVKVEGDRLYVLNPYKGFMVFDLTEPLHPAFLGRAPIIGDPFEMYVVGSIAYVIVTASYGWWYYNTWHNPYAIQAVLDDGVGTDESFYVGSKVLVIDLEDESDPRVVARFGLEGEVTDSRRVGDVIYFVSNVYGWYQRSVDGTNGEDMTSVMALNMADPSSPMVEDRVTFRSATNVIHVSQQYVFVAQAPDYTESWSGRTTITIVDIRNPSGAMEVRGSYVMTGRVYDRYMLDCYEEMLRVVSFDTSGQGSSTLSVLDIGDPDVPTLLGSLSIADAGDLMATRFAGERAYTIHLPRPVRRDPLDVIDLSDPASPRLCDVLEIPGWVTHIEVRGYRLLALGVDSTTWPQGVSMSLFDVTNPDEAVLLSRVTVGEGSVWSAANNDPKALTVLDERGIALIPFVSTKLDPLSHLHEQRSGVQVIEFDLEEGSLRLAGSFEQPESVIRTRAVGEAVVSTSTSYLLAVDLADLDVPVVTSRIDFRCEVLDLYLRDGLAAAVVRAGDDRGLELRTLRASDTEAMCPITSNPLGSRHGSWGWQEGGFLFLHSEHSDGTTSTMLQAFELVDGGGIRKAGECDLAGTYSFSDTRPWTTTGSESSSVTSWDQYGSYIDEAVLQLQGTVVLKDGRELAILDVRDIDHPGLCSQYHLDFDAIVDIRAMGSKLYITYREATSVEPVMAPDAFGRRVVDEWERFYLLTLDISDIESPRASHPVNIPGIPVGVSRDGGTIYTVAYWKLSPEGEYTKTLNVVHLLGIVAYLSYAIEVNISSMVATDGDIAYVLTPGAVGYDRWSYWGVDLCVGVDWSTPATYQPPGPSELWVIDLGSWRERGVLAHAVVGESCSSLHILGGSLVLDLGEQEGLVVMRLSALDGVRLVGSYETTGTVLSFRQYGDRGYLAQGEFGITSIELM